MRISILTTLTLSLALFACGDDDGGGSDGGATDGGDRSRTIESLDMSEARAECSVFIDSLGGPGETMCEGGLDITVQTVDDCAASIEPATCTNTLAELDNCRVALAGDPCGLLSEPACSFFLSCASGG